MSKIDDPTQHHKIILGSLTLCQVQMTLVACVAAGITILLSNKRMFCG